MRRNDNIENISDIWEDKEAPKTKKTSKHPVLIFIFACILAIAAGAAVTYAVYGTDLWYDAYSLAGRAGLLPGYEQTEPFDREKDKEDKAAENGTKDEDIEKDIPGSQKENTDDVEAAEEEEAEEAKPFVPVENPPVLNIENGGDTALTVSEIHDVMQTSVVAVVNYTDEDKRSGYGLGSGVIFTSDGYIITNSHVIEDAYSIEIVLSDGETVPAKLIANDSTADIAIIKAEKDGLPAASFGKSNELKVGDQVVAIGCPASLELQGTTTVGNVSAVNRKVTIDSSGNRRTFIQTDASVNPGNSGGPLINCYGQVVGIITAKLSAYSYEGIGFAIPSEDLVDIVADLFAYGYVRGYPSIGIMAKGVAENEMGTNPEGVYVDSVNENGGAYGKLLAGDIIIEVEGQTVYTVSDINMIKGDFTAGDTLHMKVWRAGETTEVDIILADQHDIQ